MKDTLVLFPSPGIGHLISMVELGKRFFLEHELSVTVITTNPPFNTGSTAPYIRRVAASGLDISFFELPPVDLSFDSVTHSEYLTFEFLLSCKPLLLQALKFISQNSRVRALIMDFFCSCSLDVADQLQIPAYFFFTSGAGVLAAYLNFPAIHSRIPISFRELKANLQIPGNPPVPSDDMPMPMMDRHDNKAYDWFLYHSSRLPEGRGIIVNTFESLEPRALETLRHGLCIPDKTTPAIYPIGPMIASEDQSGRGVDAGAACLEWLDEKPISSVVFLCFGSLGFFSAAQIREIAVGLERSGQRFLWVLRSPPAEEKSKRYMEPPEPDLDVLLPEGFLDRTSERGLVVKSWAPQVAVLYKPSVGGFVTHCGWNSVLESICAGVPMVGWPLYAEQRLNRLLLVKELKLAFAVDMAEDGFVKAEEVERCLRLLMDSEEGASLRERTLAMKESATVALRKCGSSDSTLAELAMTCKYG